MSWKRPRRTIVFSAIALALVALRIDDWGRDLVEYEARIGLESRDPRLRPLEIGRPAADAVELARMAASRMPDWHFVGDSRDGATWRLIFERQGRLFRWTDDIVIQVETRHDRSIVSGESRSRLQLGDFGRNPRNLRRFLAELGEVDRGARPSRAADPGAAGER